MSHRATVWAYGVRDLSPAAKLVLLKLADCANDEGLCWPSQTRVAEDCGMLRQSVNRIVRILSVRGLVALGRQVAPGRGKTVNMYQLSMADETSPDIGHTPDETPGFTPMKHQVSCHETPGFMEPSLEPSREPFPPIVPPKSDFEQWWQGYPHKVGKDAAKAKWTIARRRASLAELIAGVQRYVASKPPDLSWCNPATWLHQGRWADEPAYASAEAPRDGPQGPPPKPEDVYPELRRAGGSS